MLKEAAEWIVAHTEKLIAANRMSLEAQHLHPA